MTASPARVAAYKFLVDGSLHRISIADKIDNELDTRDSKFAEKLIRGVESYKPCLDFAIRKCCTSGTRISRKVLVALEIATVELLYLKKEPHVAVFEGVELVKYINRHASGLANVVLKKVANLKLEDLPRYLQHGFSEEVYRILVNELGESVALSFIKMSDMKPQSSKIDNIYANISSVEIARSVCEYLTNIENFLEVGAGRGTKTALIQNFLEDEKLKNLTYDILEVSEEKIDELKYRSKANSLKINNYFCGDAANFTANKRYDVVFVDAPCSGLGTIRKHREIRWRVTSSDIESLHNINVSILKNLTNLVKKNGTLIYSTCTITHAENYGVIDEFLSSDLGKDFDIIRVLREPSLTKVDDAHFCVALEKKI